MNGKGKVEKYIEFLKKNVDSFKFLIKEFG